MPKKDQEKRQIWESKIQHWLESGFNQVQWCKQNKESRDKLYYWRQEIIPNYRKNVRDTVTCNLSCNKLYFYNSPIHMQKGFEGLLRLVIEKHDEQVTLGSFFAFVNKRCNKIKVLYYSENGLVIWNKRLERGTISIEIDHFTSENKSEFIRII